MNYFIYLYLVYLLTVPFGLDVFNLLETRLKGWKWSWGYEYFNPNTTQETQETRKTQETQHNT